MKKTLVILFILSSFTHLFSQHNIKIKEEKVELNNQKFYVVSVIDRRNNKSGIGEIQKGTFKKPEKIDIEGGLEDAAENYFINNFPKTSENQQKTEVQIKYLFVNQELTRDAERGYLKIIIDFIDADGFRFETNAEITDEVDDALSTHEERIRRGFYECVVKYNNALGRNENTKTNNESEEEAVEIVFDKKEEVDTEEYKISEKRKPANRNITTVGYQIGGLTLLGIDHEIRLHDYVGIHVGGGIFGYTGGVKIHTNERTNSLFFNLSWKDGGFGLVNGVGIEAGARWVWSKRTGFGLLYQGGVYIINHMDQEYIDLVYGTSEVPQLLFTIGLGLSW